MTTYVFNAADLPNAPGSTISNGAVTDADGGWQLTAVTSTGGTLTFDGTGIDCVGNAGVARLDGSVTPATMLSLEFLLDIAALPTGAQNRILEIRHASNYLLRLEHQTDGTIKMHNAVNAAIWTSPAFGTGLLRGHIGIDPGVGTADGKIRANFYKTDAETSTTPDAFFPPSDVQNAGTADVVVARVGRLSSTAASTASVTVLYVKADDTTIEPLGPLASPPATVEPQLRYWNGTALADLYLWLNDNGTLSPLDLGETTPPPPSGSITTTLLAANQSATRVATVQASTAGAVQGSLMSLWVRLEGARTLTTPTGWTLSAQAYSGVNGSGGNANLYLLTKVADATDAAGATVDLVFSSTARWGYVLAAHSGATTVDVVATRNGTAVETDNSIEAPSVTTTVAGAELVVGYALAGVASAMTFTPQGTKVADLTGVSVSTLLCVAEETVAAAGATGIRTAAITTTGEEAAITAALRG